MELVAESVFDVKKYDVRVQRKRMSVHQVFVRSVFIKLINSAGRSREFMLCRGKYLREYVLCRSAE